MEFSGRLAAFPMSDILQWVANERRSGKLVVRRSGREKWVYFRGGKVVGCVSDDPGEFYGQHLILAGVIDQAELVMALTFCKKQGCRLGEALCELGMVPPEKVEETLRRQIQDSICDLFLWQHGVFYFADEQPPEAGLAPAPVETMTLVMEGARWADEHRRIRELFPHDNLTLGPGPAWDDDRWRDGPMSVRSRIIEALMPGPETLAALYGSIKGSYFRFLEAAHDLVVRGVLDIQAVGEETASPAQELSVYDLLFEEAAGAEGLPLSRSLPLPIELVQRFYPLWLGDAEEAQMPESARAFYRRFDGGVPLAEILAPDAAARSREVELLLLQLEKGNLALLPAPISRVEKARKERIARRWWRGRRSKTDPE